MIATEQTLPIFGFGGLDKKKNKPSPETGYTRSLRNVYVKEGTVIGRGGVDFDTTFSAAMSESVCGLMPYISSTLATTILRIGSTKIEKSTGGAWTDITGTALTGAATDRPQWANYRDALYWTNEGQDRPRYWAGTGNTNVISTAPWAKGMMSYFGFLFLLNVSDDGSLFYPRRARYSEDPQNDWTLCEGNELNFHETPGAVVAGGVFGRTAVILKEDGLVYLRWIGGPVRFAQELAKGAPGTLAPRSGQPMGEKGFIYLGDDYELWVASGNEVAPVPPRVNDILQSDLYKTNVGFCTSCVVPSNDQYNLFFPLDSSGNTGRITLNYRTGEFSYSTYPGHGWDDVIMARLTATANESLIGAVNTRVYTLDSTPKVDEITGSTEQAVSRFYDTDWLQYSNRNEGRVVQAASQFTGATLTFKASAHAKCAVSVAVDKQNLFRYRKVYSLRPVYKTDEYTSIRYDVAPISGEWFNVRIEFLPSATENPVLHSGGLHFIPDMTKSDVNRAGRISQD